MSGDRLTEALEDAIRLWPNHPYLVLPGPVDLASHLARFLAEVIAGADDLAVVATTGDCEFCHKPALAVQDDGMPICDDCAVPQVSPDCEHRWLIHIDMSPLWVCTECEGKLPIAVWHQVKEARRG